MHRVAVLTLEVTTGRIRLTRSVQIVRTAEIRPDLV